MNVELRRPKLPEEPRPLDVAHDWKHPDYGAIYQARIENLRTIRGASAAAMADLKAYYREDPEGPANFINDWGVTFDPRNAEIGLPTYLPMILFQRQRDWIRWVMARWRAREDGLCEKSRDVGVSWLAMSLSCTLCLFFEGVAIGVGSRKAQYVDEIGTLKPLLPKARIFVENLPEEFRGPWEGWRDAPKMRVTFPQTGSIISGEGGDDIGRGDRTAIYFVDEAAHLERPELVDASLSQTTNCRIDMSSVRGMNNSFARKRHEGKVDVFIFDWREDPRKDEAWYRKQCDRLDPVVVAQEIDRDYLASVSGIVIPGQWVRSAIDARQKLKLPPPTGARGLALDVADEGADKNAHAHTHGTEVVWTREWSGKGSDIYDTVERTFAACDELKIDSFDYDADGLGAGVRGDSRSLNENRAAARLPSIRAVGFRGSEGVFDPEGIVEGTMGREGDPGRTNQDYFLNRAAQSWWNLRTMFQKTHRWVAEGVACKPDEIISISSRCPDHQKLAAELSQATWSLNKQGKVQINKKPDGQKSPNRADAVRIKFAPKEPPPMTITPDIISAIVRAGAMQQLHRTRRGR